MINYNYNVSTSSASGIGAGLLVFYLIVLLFYVACYWRIFTKAGEAGWKAIIPIYSTIIVLKIIKRPWWWIFLFLIPIVNLVIGIIVALDLAKFFGKSPIFAVFGLIIFSFVGYPMLAFGSATYNGGKGSAPSAPTPAAPTPTPQPPAAAPTSPSA